MRPSRGDLRAGWDSRLRHGRSTWHAPSTSSSSAPGPAARPSPGSWREAGLEVVAVEKHLVGGECPYYGCIPSKMIIRAADALAEGRRIPELAGSSAVVERLQRGRRADPDPGHRRLERPGRRGATRGQGLHRHPRHRDPRRREHRRGSATRSSPPVAPIVINTGTSPAVPPIPGLADTPYWTNRDVLQTRTAPEPRGDRRRRHRTRTGPGVLPGSVPPCT